MAKPNTIPVRSDPMFKELIDDVLEGKPRKVKSPRITKAIANQYIKYPLLLKELKEAELR